MSTFGMGDENSKTTTEVADQLRTLSESPSDYILIPEFDENLLLELDPTESQLISTTLEVLPIAADIYEEYSQNYQSYDGWNSFWFSSDIQQKAQNIAEILVRAASEIPNNAGCFAHKQYLIALAQDWVNGASRDTSISEPLWYKLPKNRVDIRGLPRIEKGHESYTHPEADSEAGDPTFSIRLKREKLLDESTRLIEAAIISNLGSRAERIWSKTNKSVSEDVVLAASALHGYKVAGRPTGHQYKLLGPDGSLNLAIISNVNIQGMNKKLVRDFAEQRFAPSTFNAIQHILDTDSIDLLYGHEVAEALIEYMYGEQLEVLGRREAIEILANIVILDSIAKARTYPANAYTHLSEFWAIGMLARIERAMTLQPTKKSLVYQRGYRLFLDRLAEARAIVSDHDGRILHINQRSFDTVVPRLKEDLMGLIAEEDIALNNRFFAAYPFSNN